MTRPARTIPTPSPPAWAGAGASRSGCSCRWWRANRSSPLVSRLAPPYVPQFGRHPLALADSLDAKDWRELQLAPIWILSAVGAADGKIDKAERAALVEGVNGCAAHSDPFVSQVFAATARNMDALWTDYMQDE